MKANHSLGFVSRLRRDIGFAAVLLTAIFTLTFAACGGDDGGGSNLTPPAPKYTVTFNSNGGSAVDSQSVELGGKVTKPADPTLAGSTFAGWFADAAFNRRWDFERDVITENTTFYAKWVDGGNVTLYTVTFDTDGGSAIAPVEGIAPNEQFSIIPYRTEKPGYIFRGWTLEGQYTHRL